MKKVYLFAATQFEILPALQHLEENFTKKSFSEYSKEGLSVFPVVTGIGSMLTSLAMSRTNKIIEADMLINVGVAGSYNSEIGIGTVVEVVEDRFADLGVEEADGSFTDVFEMELMQKDQFPFEKGLIKNEAQTNYQRVSGVTVNKVNGTKASIDKIIKKYGPEIESMEGAAFLYTAKIMDIKALQLRAISNMVEPRNKDNWDLEKAIKSLNLALIGLLK